MKIALVAQHTTPTNATTPPTQALDPYSADQAAQVSGLGRALAAQGHDVVIYARKDSPKLPGRATIAPRLKVEYIEAGPLAALPPDQIPQYTKDIATYLTARWRKNAPDVVQAFHWTNGLAALSAVRELTTVCEHPIPVVATFGSLGTAERRHRIAGEDPGIRTRMESAVARAATMVLASTSDEVAELARLGVPNIKVRLVPLGVDTDIFKPAGLIAKRNTTPRLIAVGSLAEYRGLDVLLRCLAELPGAELVIAGGPPADELESDHGYRILAKLAANLGVADRVQFTGHVSDRNLPGLLRSADLLVSTARYEPQGLAALRAMACGIPVIATAIGAYRDAIIDGTTGLLIPPGRPETLVRRLRDLLGSPMRLAAFGIAAADRAKSRYPWERVASETLTVYERAVTRTADLAPALATAATATTVTTATGPVMARPARVHALRPARKRSALVTAGGQAA